MKANAFALSAVAALALAGLASTGRAAVDKPSGPPSNQITIPGTVVSSSHDKLVIRTDDHHHRMAFDVASASALPENVRKGAHVSVTYHPEGSTGQQVDRVEVVDRTASVPSQAAFVLVTGGTGGVRVGAR
jgi:type 1 fimbria pilin